MLRRHLTAVETRTWVLFFALVTVGVLGRLWQPEYNVTPLAAITLPAMLCFGSRWMTALLPITALLISNLWLPAYNNLTEQLVVLGCFTVPALLHGWVRRGGDSWATLLPRLMTVGWLPSCLFFVLTNFVVWIQERGTAFDNSWHGLMQCYAVALPFFRWMLQGDLLYGALAVGTYALAVSRQPQQATTGQIAC